MLDKKEVTIVVADDHPMLLKGLREELDDNGYNVIGAAANGMQALELVITLKPTIALLDIDMPMLTGFEVVSIAKEKQSPTKFVLLSFHKEKDFVVQAKALNIMGYLLKEDSFNVVEQCIERVVNDLEFYSPSFEVETMYSANEELKSMAALSPSELKILKLIAEDLSTIQISKQLFISPRTVDKHRSNIINKLMIGRSTNALTNWAAKNCEFILSY